MFSLILCVFVVSFVFILLGISIVVAHYLHTLTYLCETSLCCMMLHVCYFRVISIVSVHLFTDRGTFSFETGIIPVCAGRNFKYVCACECVSHDAWNGWLE